MLVLSRKRKEKVVISKDVTVEVLEIQGDRVRLGIIAPRSMPVHRHEIWVKIQQQEKQCISSPSAASVANTLSSEPCPSPTP